MYTLSVSPENRGLKLITFNILQYILFTLSVSPENRGLKLQRLPRLRMLQDFERQPRK